MSEFFECVRVELAKIEFKPGDKFVMQFDRPINAEQINVVAGLWDKFMPGTPLLITLPGQTLFKIEGTETPIG